MKENSLFIIFAMKSKQETSNRNEQLELKEMHQFTAKFSAN